MLQICNGADQFETGLVSPDARLGRFTAAVVRAVESEAFAVRALFALRQIVAESA
jgi:hypothetical protein